MKNNIEIKEKILDLLIGMRSDSKTESYKCEKELCSLLQSITDKMEQIENALGYPIREYYPIQNIDNDYIYDALPEVIWCNDGTFEFKMKWIDIDLKEYFEEIKSKVISIKENTIKNVENSLVKHRRELEKIQMMKHTSFI